MAKKKIYRTVIKFTVLSEEPISEEMSLDSILSEADEGSYVMGAITKSEPKELVGKTAVIEIERLGSEAEFFMMDALGNELEEVEAYCSDGTRAIGLGTKAA